MVEYAPIEADRISRRRLLALAGGAAAATSLGPVRAAARQDSVAETGAEFPLPGTLAADASPEFQAVADALVDAMRRHRVPGTAIGILAGDREEHATFGIASIASLAPVTPATLFQIGSLTKTFTATAIWRLIDEGVYAVDAPIRTYIPDFQLVDESVAADVTIGHLLDHTAGWLGDEGYDTGEHDDAIARYVAERLPVLPQVFPLGAFFSYNNAAFILLGRLIEIATGTPYNAAIQDLLCAPLGLSESILDRDMVRRHPYADSHAALPINGRDVIAIQTPLWLPRSVDPAGGIWSTTRDVLRYARFHLAAEQSTGSGAAVVSSESLLRMREPEVDVPGLPMQMGRNWFMQDVEGTRVFWHTGDTLGQHTEFVVVPEHNFAFVLLTNGSGGTAASMDVLDAALAIYPGLSALSGKAGITHASLAPADAEPVSLPPETLAEYVGQYAEPGSAYTVAAADDGLEMSGRIIEEPGTLQPAIQPLPAPPAPLTFLGKDEGLGNGILRVPFVRDSAGQVAWVSFGLRLIPKVDGEA